MTIFCCADCWARADMTVRNIDKQLNELRLVAREAVRVALAEGKLSTALPEAEVSKESVLRSIAQMLQTKEKSDGSSHP